MRHGAVSAIEFFPGYFGNEEQWPSLSNPRECPPGEVTECIANTNRMRQFAPPSYFFCCPRGSEADGTMLFIRI